MMLLKNKKEKIHLLVLIGLGFCKPNERLGILIIGGPIISLIEKVKSQIAELSEASHR